MGFQYLANRLKTSMTAGKIASLTPPATGSPTTRKPGTVNYTETVQNLITKLVLIA